MNVLPVQHHYDDPGGWGYTIAAGDNMRPDNHSDDWNYSPAMGWATLLPDDAAKFLFEEGRELFKAGRLFLLPALNVGCVDEGHGPLERMFNEVTCATPFLSSHGNNGSSIGLDSLPLPYFPEIPLNELAKVVEGEGDSLLETRLALRYLAKNLADREKLETQEIVRECYERVQSGLKEVERRFKDLARRLEWAHDEGKIHSYVFDAEKFEISPGHLAAAELANLHDELHAAPWYAYFRLSSQGYKWNLKRKGSSFASKAPKSIKPNHIYHWFVPPTAGWNTPLSFIG